MKKIILAIAVCIMIITTACERINVGYVGLKVDQTGDSRGVNPMEYVTGRVWYNPFESDVVEFDVSMQHVEYDEFLINANGGSKFTIKPYINFMVQANCADLIYQTFKTTDLDAISTQYLRNAVYQTFTDITGKYTPDSLLKHREHYEHEIYRTLAKSIKTKGFILQQVTSNMVPPQSLIDAIDAKNKVDQETQTVELGVAKAIAQAKKDVAQARGDSASNVIRAAGKNRAYELEQRNLTPLLLRKMEIEQWDGKYPVYGTVPQLFKNTQ